MPLHDPPPAADEPLEAEPDVFERLAPSARRASPRVRLGIGAAIVLCLAALGVSAVVSATASGGGTQHLPGVDAVGSPPAETAPETDSPALLVHVTGAVRAPGIVELAPGSRVVDAVAAAGGLADDADAEAVNLAGPVADGEQLRVPVVGEAPAAGGAGAGGAGAGGADGVVDLNRADAAALETLPRIGPALAERIIAWREANGPFTSVDQLDEVSGIGEAVLAGLEGLVRV
ncbi:ComEA family DNA-binding protein [Agromyces archimandritae]|uniref:ComEA family DNA-binding protein n=1 Tax=Agromyces archimandritae TaxID=2781962 RepID=A0A975INT0_9MICO|nr:ComEA family DNA-binding protein [Agromyces archimandritae]QTX04880.1 ComEA family DNA-binding protein [Agromyces archimandritae]